MSAINRIISVLLLAWMIVFSAGCPEEVDPKFPPPDPVKLIPYTGDSGPVEKGVRSEIGNTAVIIEWEKPDNPGTPIREFRIFRSLGLDSPFTLVGSVFENQNPIFNDNKIVLDTLVYYYVQAVDTRGKTSPAEKYFHPDSIAKYVAAIMVKRAANPYRPFSTDTVTTKPVLTWCYPVIDIPSEYVIKLARSSSQVIWIAKIPNRIYTAGCDESGDKERLMFNHESYTVPNDSLQASTSVTVTYADPVWITGARLPKGSYYWRIESRWGNPVYHARSNWASFTISQDFIYP